MKLFRNIVAVLSAAIVMVLFLKIPAIASAQTLGAIGVIDTPMNTSTIKGQTMISGWFLDDSGVSKVEVLVDGTAVGQAVYGDARPDVQNAYLQYKNGNSGFHFALDTTKFSDGKHTVAIRETGMNGRVNTLPGVTITIANVKGYVDNPVSGSTLTGITNVSGWLLDESGVVKIEVLVDGALAGEAAYGDARKDVQKAFPEYNNGNSGFHFALDTTKFSDGKHTVTIKETGISGRVNTLSENTVTFANVKGYLDNPVSGRTLTGTANVSGWFLDGSGVAKIEVLVDGTLAGQAVYGDARTDVRKAFPQFNNGNSGFHFALDTTQFSDGNHTITIKETGIDGRVKTLPESTVTFANVKGYLDNPVSGRTLTGSSNVSGWFLDGSGVAKIEVLIDGTVAGQAEYGDARTDVQKAFPEFNNGNSGFHFTLDTTQFGDGKHTVTIKETGISGRVNTLPESTVTFANVKGYLDNPVSGRTLTGTTNVSGWFLDGSGVAKIEVLVDGTVAGQAEYGDARTDVQKAFSEFNNGNSGFHFALDTTQFTDGKHTVMIRETGINGHVNTLPESTITIANVKGYLDNPAPGETLKGIKNVSGWFLDKSGVASIEILVDGVTVGQAEYGDPRDDIQKVFPEFNNGNAGFHFALDTTKFADGKHTITIRETGLNGRVTILPESKVTFKQSSMIVFLDPGHGGSDPGATASGFRESDLNLAVAKKVKSLLLSQGYSVYMSRENDTYVSLLDRSQMANNIPTDIFVSIHTNSGPSSASGIESYFYEYDPAYPSIINGAMHNNPDRILKSMALANLIQENMTNYTGANDRGADGASFAVIREAAMPATLLEIGFISNTSERQKLFTDAYQNTLARAIADGIDEYSKNY
ncbi:N-acetylmuramoyl-L-alanine amidase [Neobacillus sp. GCM10023253]|uniref:N-acetylmuramoyl-L-alanine amidase n=1 Tax=Neobacillus sp. GCM10023253 TaxID=3252644 RepID=UPI0036208DFB